jgi:CMP-N-acetylneuraminic acid synthetase
MIAALLLGREGSVGFPGKNFYEILGRSLMEYALLAALNAKFVDEVYVSTDSPKIKEISNRNGAVIIDRPAYLCTKEALGEDAFVHGYKHIKDQLGKEIEFMVLLHCNGPCLLAAQIDEGICVLRDHPGYDSAVTVSEYNMYSPVRARKIGEDYPRQMKINCNRDAQGAVYFADVCLSVVRPRCLDEIEKGELPQRWMGRNIYPIKQWGGLDIDFEWQVPQVEYWLKKHGFTHDKTPYGT